jgi:tRNA threonylcarbamoyladenosine biosynthesis protein TsaE
MALGELVADGDAIALRGHLGAGKTLLVQGLARGLGVPPTLRVTSPTFTLLNQYRGGRLLLFHADLYRIEAESELREIGIDEALGAGGVIAVEWADRFSVLPADRLEVSLEVTHDDERALDAFGSGSRSKALAAQWGELLAQRLREPDNRND